MKPDMAKLREDAMRASGRVATTARTLAMRTGGAAITEARRDELLAQCLAGEYVEIELDVLAFEQRTGERNRNFVRVRDGAMVALGRSGRGTPVLRDHRQNDVTARAGTVISSSTVKRGDGDYAIQQTWSLTAPWAVELAMRGLLDTVSIGMHETGPVMCSVCDAPVFTRCYHFPGDTLSVRTGEDGSTREVYDAEGSIVVEWIFTAADLVETSVVSVPAVPGAHIEGIRAALAAGADLSRGAEPQEYPMRNLLANLSLPPTAGEDEVITAVTTIRSERDTARSELAIADSERVRLAAIVEQHQAKERQTAEDTFVRDALSTGRIAKGDEGAWRDLYQANSDRARSRMSERKAGCSTPVGQPLQSAVIAQPAPDTKSEEARAQLGAAGVNTDNVIAFAKMFGAKTPEKTLALMYGTEGR